MGEVVKKLLHLYVGMLAYEEYGYVMVGFDPFEKAGYIWSEVLVNEHDLVSIVEIGLLVADN